MVTFALMSKEGSRDKNEDSIGMFQDGERYCFVLADGLGGHGKGEVASRIAVDNVIKIFSEGHNKNFFCNAFHEAQNSIINKQQEERFCRDMKTTLVILKLEKDVISWGHIGDSRLYYFCKGKIKKRTLDHSVPQMLALAGEIKEKEIRHHPDRNRLLKVLGTESMGKYEESEEIVRGGRQAFLLCSDGFWELIDEKKMESTLRSSSTPQEWLDAMERIVIRNGRGIQMDNYSAITVWIDEK